MVGLTLSCTQYVQRKLEVNFSIWTVPVECRDRRRVGLIVKKIQRERILAKHALIAALSISGRPLLIHLNLKPLRVTERKIVRYRIEGIEFSRYQLSVSFYSVQS